jgi:outer membrane lipoprotein-sorting protein
MSLLISNDEMTIWYRDLERAETASVGRQSQRILEYMGASASMDKLVQYFTVSLRMPETETDPFILRLSPRYERVAKRIRELETWIDSTLFLPLRLRYVEGDGDVTEYRFSNLRVNEGLPEDRFVLEIPGTVEVRAGQFDPQGR